MQCVFVRHGEALNGADDAERALSDVGRAQVNAAASWLAAHWGPDTVICSPLRRARQTARAFGQTLGLPAVVESGALAPDAAPATLSELIEQHSEHGKLLLIGHNPLLSEILPWFCGDRAREPMATASMAMVDVDIIAPGGGTLRWVRHYPNYEQVACRQ